MASLTSRPRRLLTGLVLAVAGTLWLASCGAAGPDPGPAPGAGPTTSAAAPTAAAFPVTVDHMHGSTTIPQQPTRVVTLGLSDQDPLLALGVKPVAVSEWYGDYDSATWPWAQDELGDAKPVVLNHGVRDEANPPYEEIAALAPDLILSLYNGTTKKQYDLLSQIAPTVVPDAEFGNFTITWQEATRATGEALGREADAVALVRRLEQSFADAKAARPAFAGKTVVVAERFEAGKSVVRSGNDVRAQFFGQLGFSVPTEVAGAKPNEYGEITVSDELMPDLSKDLLVWNIGFDQGLRRTIEGLPVYRTLPVVRDGKVLWVEDEVVSGAFSWGTVLSLDYALQQLLPQIDQVVR